MALRDGYRLDQTSGALRDGYVLDQGSAALRDGYDNILSTGGGSESVGFRLDTLANLQVFATVMTRQCRCLGGYIHQRHHRFRLHRSRNQFTRPLHLQRNQQRHGDDD